MLMNELKEIDLTLLHAIMKNTDLKHRDWEVKVYIMEHSVMFVVTFEDNDNLWNEQEFNNYDDLFNFIAMLPSNAERNAPIQKSPQKSEKEKVTELHDKLSQCAYLLGVATGAMGGIHSMLDGSQGIKPNAIKELRDLLARGVNEIFYTQPKRESC